MRRVRKMPKCEEYMYLGETSVKDLKKIAKQKKLRGYSKMKKAQLVRALGPLARTDYKKKRKAYKARKRRRRAARARR